MALSPQIITSQIILAGTGSMDGSAFPQVAVAIGSAVYEWIITPGNFTLIGVATGEPGPPGIVNGVFSVLTNPAIITAALTGSNVVGLTAPTLAIAISHGLTTAFNTSAQYVGITTGVALGFDNSTVQVSNSLTLIGLLASKFDGSSAGLVSSGLGVGIATLLQTGVGGGTVSGAPVSPTPITSPSFSTVF